MEAASFILFGATGDLAARKIYPALYNLYIDQKLPASFSVIGLGRRLQSDSQFQARVERALHTYSRRPLHDVDPSVLQQFLDSFRYCSLDVTAKQDYRKLLELVQIRERQLGIPENRMFYMSVAPELYGSIADNIIESGLSNVNGWKRLLIEKPFGSDLASAGALNRLLNRAFQEDEIYRMDHYLGKPMVQNLEVLEYTNPILQALWNNHYVANVQITASEAVGVEQRAGYYDQTGAIRDMFQNHMLQLLTMFAMHLPKNSTAETVSFKKKKVLEALRPILKEEAVQHVVRGQYRSGTIDESPVIGYTEEPGIRADSVTDTFIAARLWIDHPFWSEVPFYIRTGKRMKQKSTRIVVEFKDPLDKFTRTNEITAPNLLVIEISPEAGMSFRLNMKNPLKGGRIEPVKIEFAAEQANVPEAYESLIHDALCADSTFFAHWEEAELAWKWLQPILEAFQENLIPLHPYEAGTDGPKASSQLLEEDGFQWWAD